VHAIFQDFFYSSSVELGIQACVDPPTKINHVARYAVTKALQILTVRELASILPVSDTGVVINVLSPGLCSTELDRNGTFRERLPVLIGRIMMGRTAEAGSRTLLHAAVAGTQSHGAYVSDCQIKE